MRLKFAVPLVLALASLTLPEQTARASHCGACDYPAGSSCAEQCCVPSVRYRVCYQTVEEQKSCVCYRPVYQTVMKECRYTVCKPVYEQHVRECRYTVCKPVCETCYKECCVTVCKPLCETH